MRTLNRSFIFLLACVLCLSNCFVSASASDEGMITVGSVDGYPGDIVAVPISITALPSAGFASGSFDVRFGDNLEFVNAVQCGNNYGTLYFGRPTDANAEKNCFNILSLDWTSSKNFNYTKQMATAYFRIKSDALPSDDASKSTVTVSTTGSINKDLQKVSFGSSEGCVRILERSSALGEKLVGHSLTLEGEISLNFHVDIPDALLSSDGAFVEYVINGQEETVVTEKLSECKKDENGKAVLSCSLPSPMWSRTVTARISDGNGNFGDDYTYSVKNYALYMISGNYTTGNSTKDALLKELCVALLNYGGYSQKYFGYFSDSEFELANGNVLFGDNNLISDYIYDVNDEDIISYKSASLTDASPSIDYFGVNIAVDAATAITHYFVLEGNTSDYVFKLSGPVSDEVILEPFVFEGKIAVKISDIPAAYFDAPYTVTAEPLVADGSSLTVTYSVRDYMAHNLNTANDALKDLIRAMYLYGIAADAYF